MFVFFVIKIIVFLKGCVAWRGYRSDRDEGWLVCVETESSSGRLYSPRLRSARRRCLDLWNKGAPVQSPRYTWLSTSPSHSVLSYVEKRRTPAGRQSENLFYSLLLLLLLLLLLRSFLILYGSTGVASSVSIVIFLASSVRSAYIYSG